MEEISKVVLTFKGQQYSLLKAKSKADTGPIATFAVSDIVPGDDLFKLSANCPQFHGGSVSFFKHEGKYVVFGGREQVAHDIAKGKTHISGHVLSSPALKAARIDTPAAPAPAQVEALANKFNSAPSNRAEVRTPRKPYGSRPTISRPTSGGNQYARSK